MRELADNPVPQAEAIENVRSYHNQKLYDYYSWLRDKDWQEILHNPSKLSPKIRSYLEAENSYQENFMHSTAALQEQLFLELKSRIKEDDSSVPMPHDSYHYGWCYEKGAGLPNFYRISQQGDREIYLDGEKEKKSHGSPDYFQIIAVCHSPDHKFFAFAYDDRGSEFASIEIRHFAKSGQNFTEILRNTSGKIAWAADSSGFFYTKLNENHRPYEVYFHILGQDQSEDMLIYREEDSSFFMGVEASREGKYIFINIHDHRTSEIWLINAEKPTQKPRRIRKRETGIEYYIQAGDGEFYIRTNLDGARDFQIMRASEEQLFNDGWQSYIGYKEGRLIEELALYKDFVVWQQMENGLPSICFKKRCQESSKLQTIDFNEEVYDLNLVAGFEYATEKLRFSYSSPTTAGQLFEYNMLTNERILLKQQEIPCGHDSGQYIAKRLMAPSRDGEMIPISLFYHKNIKIDGSAPCLLYGYGAYGISIPACFNSNSFSLVNRGFIYAIAHIRGGKEKGAKWYDQGKLHNKTNSFYDFIDCAKYLCEKNYTSKKNIVAYGGSAGGMLMGAVANIEPQLFHAIIAIVPFVDVLNTMLDDSLPLTPPEWGEWGNPLANEQDYRTIASYSPYDNIKNQDYPHILAISGLTDPRVTYWEAAKWVAKLRQYKTDNNSLLLKTNMDSGHGGSSDRFDKLKETAFIYAYILKIFNLEEAQLY